MPRTARASVGGICYHVLNRGNALADVFHDVEDYQAFLKLLQRSVEERGMRIVAFCLMPNHFHALVWPRVDRELSQWMQWLLTTHVRRYHRMYQSSGHVWQGRFKAFPVQQDEHVLMVRRYIEQNPVRSRLVTKAEEWRWSSISGREPWLHSGPVERSAGWKKLVNTPLTGDEVDTIRRSVYRGAPYGQESWVRRTVKRLGLEASVNPRGRPRKLS
ncbi:MAG: transposase [Nitrospirales bacterium]|nr:transposase [Nitrospira sp.]MDR4501429.1 transposase [Nitrospirales bacterium]